MVLPTYGYADTFDSSKYQIMKKLTITALLFILIGSATAQDDFYTSISSNTSGVNYEEYSTYHKEGGKYKLTKYVNNYLTLALKKIPTGEYVGFALSWEEKPTNGSQIRASENVLGDYGRAPSYPDVSYIYHSYRKDGYVALDGIIYKLEGISKDGLSFKTIARIYVPIKSATKEKSETITSGKKLSLKEKMNALKDAALESSASSNGNGYPISKQAKPLLDVDLNTKITNYLKVMKTKYDAHSSTPEVVQAQKNIENARQNKSEAIDAANDAIKRGPQYQKTLQNNANAQASKDRKNFIKVEGTDAKVDNCKYYIKNEGSETFYYINSSQKKGSIAPGAIQEFSCYYLAFFADGDNKGKLIGGGGQSSRDRTYTVK